MTTFFSACSSNQLSLDQLSNKEVLAKQARIKQIGYIILLLLALFVGMALVLSSYLVAASSWALIPAVADYNKNRKAIKRQLQKRSLA